MLQKRRLSLNRISYFPPSDTGQIRIEYDIRDAAKESDAPKIVKY